MARRIEIRDLEVDALTGIVTVLRARSATISDMSLCYEAFRAQYGQIKDAVTGNVRDRTDDEVFAAWSTGFMLGTVSNVNGYLDSRDRKAVTPAAISAAPDQA